MARELFKPSTDAASLLGSIKKNIFWFGWGVCLGEAHKLEVFLFFWPTLTGLRRQSNGPKFWLKRFLKTRWSPASIEPLRDLLACLEPKLWPKNPILPPKSENADFRTKHSTPTPPKNLRLLTTPAPQPWSWRCALKSFWSHTYYSIWVQCVFFCFEHI